MDEETYHITIEGDGLSFDKDVPKEIGDKILVLILSGSLPKSSGKFRQSSQSSNLVDSDFEETPGEGIPKISIQEYISSTNANRNPDKITSIGVYIQEFLGVETFSKADLIKHFQQASESIPKNITRDIKWTIKSGWIAQSPSDPKLFYVTTSGKNAVSQKFPKELVQRAKQPRAGMKKTMSTSNEKSEE